MSRLIASGFTTAETTFGGAAQPLQSSLGSGSAGGLHVKKIVAFGASSVAENTSGGINFVYGNSSGSPESTLTIMGGPTSNATVVTLDGLDIRCRFFDFRTNEAGAGGYGIFVFGE